MASWHPDRKTAALAALRRVNEEIEAAAGLVDTPEERARLIRHLDLASYFKLFAARQFPSIDAEDPAAPAIDFEQLYLCYFDLYAIAEAISNTLTKTAAGQRLGPGDQTLDQEIEWVERLLERIADWFDVLLSDECEAQLAMVDNELQELLDLLQRVKRGRPVSRRQIEDSHDALLEYFFFLDCLTAEERFDFWGACDYLSAIDKPLYDAKRLALGAPFVPAAVRGLLDSAHEVKAELEEKIRDGDLELPPLETSGGAGEGNGSPYRPGLEDLPPFPPPGYAFRRVTEEDGSVNVLRFLRFDDASELAVSGAARLLEKIRRRTKQKRPDAKG